MQRLTHKELNSLGSVYFTKCTYRDCGGHCICCDIPDEAEHKLKEYEDLEEQGLLLKLPCKVGDVLWCTDNNEIESFVVEEFRICAYKVDRIEIYFENASGFGLCLFDGTLDENWFLTLEEAEKALRKKVDE